MEDFTPKSLCLLGRQPELGIAELESLYGAQHVRPFGDNVLLDIEAGEINFKRLGGTVKVARLLNTEVGRSWRDIEAYMLNNSPGHIARMPEGKVTIGISAYGVKTTPAQINATALKVKQLVRESGRPARIVPNKANELSSAQVLHNKLTIRGGWELIFASDGQKIIMAQTLFVQDIEAYSARDQARPARDARVGMLPPKLAQIMLNLSAGRLEAELRTQNKTPTKQLRVLDPFCGTGVVLQEALLDGYSVYGTDLEPRMIDFSRKNLQWLVQQYPKLEGSVNLEATDSTTAEWAPFSTVASETYLGRPLNSLPEPAKLKEIVSDVNTILTKFLKNLSSQIQSGRPICLAIPAWVSNNNQVISLPLIDQISDMGYNRVKFKHVGTSELIYFRPGQTVARQLLVLVKR